jgi:hypothetical protein
VGEREQFSVRVYYDDGRRQIVRRFVSAQEACRSFQHYTSSLGARLGSTVRVIIIDRSDTWCASGSSNKASRFHHLGAAERQRAGSLPARIMPGP